MSETRLQVPLDGRGRWQFILEVERHHHRLRQLEVQRAEPGDPLVREAVEEHLRRVHTIYDEARQRHEERGGRPEEVGREVF